MKNVWSLIGKASFLFGFCVFYSCKGKEDNTAILQEINDGLVQSNQRIRISTDDVLLSLQDKVEDPKTAEKTRSIQPKALEIHVLSDSIIKFIDDLKTELKRQLASNQENTRIVFKNDDKSAKLYSKLQQFKQITLGMNDRLKEEFANSLILISKLIDTAKDGNEKFKHMLVNSPAAEAIAYLSRIQNNVAINESRLILFLFQTIAYHTEDFTWFNTIVAQNTKVLQTGQTLEVYAGVGRLSTSPSPLVKIDNFSVLVNGQGLATYKKRTSKIPGNYSIPITITFKDEEGKEQTHSFTIEYKTVSANLK